MKVEAKLAGLGLELPPPAPPAGTYQGSVRVGDLVFTAGHGPLRKVGGLVTGKLGRDLDEKQGYEAARATALSLLATLKRDLGDLDRVRRIVKVTGFVNCTPEFRAHPAVVNGFSDLMVELYGEAGRAARSAVGMASLPFDMAVEVEIVAEVAD
jgi:enamine deaminase RidA (YjgF/YER057c/UK114 family)